MELMEAIEKRRSVRKYTDVKIDGALLERLQAAVDECNAESGLSIRICVDEPSAFKSLLAYGSFRGVRNYIALIGRKDETLDEKCGYSGEKLALKAQRLGLNTCWAGGTFSRRKCKAALDMKQDEKLALVIAFGYGAEEGRPHKTKPSEKLCNFSDGLPEWFIKGLEAAKLAPTAMNQQKFYFEFLGGNRVRATAGGGFFTKVDLGIAKYHFEVGAGKSNFIWAAA